MKKPQIFSLGLFCLMNHGIFAQIPKAPESIQSPNVATFSQIGENKISSFAGTIPIDMPLCNVADGALNTSLSTSYNTAGIRPDVHPGWLGLNVNLNAGGAIIRTVNDGPDDNNIIINGKAIGFFYHPEYLNTNDWNTEAEIRYFGNFAGADTEPDDFGFEVNGLKGKFYMGENGKFRVQSDQNIKVERIGTTNEYYPPFSPPCCNSNNWYVYNNQKYMGHSAGFLLTDEAGTKYEFGGGDNNFMEYSMDFFDQAKDTWICNAWYLKSITNKSGQKINYTYQRGDFIAQMAVSVQNTADVTNGGGWWGESCDNNTSGLSPQGVYSGKLISPIYLKDITSQNTKIEFVTSETTELKYDADIFSTRINYETSTSINHPARSRAEFLYYLTNCYVPNATYDPNCTFDFTGGDPALLAKLKWRKLDAIKIYDTYGISNNLKKQFDFTYNNVGTERLMLKKIQEKDPNNIEKVNPYEFTYKTFSSKNLPNYLKSHTDHWGFNNGKIINISNDFANANFATYGDNFRSPAIGADTINYLIDMLDRIKYPTGGFTEFTFETHKYSKEANIIRSSGYTDLMQNIDAGGVRIRKTKTYEQNTNCPPIEKIFYYLKNFDPKNPSNTSLKSSGILGGKSQYYWQNYRPIPVQSNYSYTKNIFSTQSVLPATENGMGSHIGYSEIIEKSSAGGWSVYKYSNYDNGSPANQFWDEPAEFTLQETATAYEPNSSRSFMRGKLIENGNYNQLGDPINITKTNYSLLNTNFAKAMRTFRKPLCATFIYVYEGTAYKMYTNQYKVTQETTEIFNQTAVNQSVISTIKYAYNIYGQQNKIIKSQSDGSEIISYTKYVPEYVDITGDNCKSAYDLCYKNCNGDGACQGNCYFNWVQCQGSIDDASRAIIDMKNRHIWTPIETINYRKRNNTVKIIAGEISVPGYFSGQSMPNKGYKLHLNTPIDSATIALSAINTTRQFSFNTLYKLPEITIDSYNSDGNPTQITARNGLITSYVWGYRNRLPIAEIKNEIYSNISTSLGADENILLNTVVSEADIRIKINALRTNNSRKITTYTHDVIFGVKSIANPANINAFFFYDGLGKLKTATDHYGKILKDIVYHYANQPAQTGLGATPTDTLNYIATRSPRTAQDNISTNIDETTTQIGYVDGIGRPVQNLIWKGSPDKTKDIISNTNLFDGAGRNHKTILPTRSDGFLGEFKLDAEKFAKTFYRDTVCRNETLFEASPLSRPNQQFGAGQAWRVGTPKPQKFFYETTGTIQIPLYTADDNGIIYGNTYYPNNQLFMTRVQDEKGNEMIEIKDTDGKTIQKRIINDGGELLITHFVYNDLNLLKGVIQPNAYPLSASLAKTVDNLFFYNYDIRGRIIEKKVPASDLEYFVYDQWDRLVLSQNPLQKTANKWSFYKYDVINREILRGEKAYTASDTQASLQILAEANNTRFESKNATGPIFYSFSSSFPILGYIAGNASTEKIYQINYYDSYDYTNDWATGLDFISGETPHTQITLNGTLTGTKILAKPKLNNNNWLRTAHYYDFKNRLIQSRKEHLLSIDANVFSYEYNFPGELLKKKTTHKKTGKSDLIELVVNTLDHLGRVKYIDHSIGASTKRIAVYEHDDIGRMITKNLGTTANFTSSNSRQSFKDGNWLADTTWHNFQVPIPGSLVEINNNVTILTGQNAFAGNIIFNTGTIIPNGTLTLGGVSTNGTALQKVDYQYHIRGGLKGLNLDVAQNLNLSTIENDFFSYKLDYDFDYNIAKQSWKHEGSTVVRSYDFTYDQSHRLQTATYLPANQDISIINLDYDKNGNITKLQRDGKIGSGYGPIDNLTYDYSGNKLTHMQEGVGGNHDVDFVPRGSQNYTYYNDGSMKSDDNEGITNIDYDTFLRQPTTITLTGGRQINFIYAGSGELLQTDYSGTIIEQWNNVENLTYKGEEYYSLNTAEGRANYANSNWEFEYFITDHLGNVRVSFKDNGSGIATKTAITDRDPLGVILRNTQVLNGFQNRSEFQGKASEMTFGLNRIDLGYRTYNPTIGRLDRVDLLQEQRFWLTPYNNCQNMPTSIIDPTGLLDEEAEKRYADLRSLREKTKAAQSGEYNFENTFSDDGKNPKGKNENKQKIDAEEVDAELAIGLRSSNGLKIAGIGISYTINLGSFFFDPIDKQFGFNRGIGLEIAGFGAEYKESLITNDGNNKISTTKNELSWSLPLFERRIVSIFEKNNKGKTINFKTSTYDYLFQSYVKEGNIFGGEAKVGLVLDNFATRRSTKSSVAPVDNTKTILIKQILKK
jgi:RHS repeat-associated protein